MTDQIPPIQPNGTQPQIQYVQAPQQQHHWFTLVLVGLASAGIAYFLMKQDQDKYRLALEETITAKMQKFGNATQAQGHVLTSEEIAKKIKDTLGAELFKEIKKTNGEMQTLSTSVGEVKGEIQGLKEAGKIPGERKQDGSFTSALEQNRGALPSLTAINLNYDASKPGLTGLKGDWKNYTEKFTANFGEWRTENDGLRSAMTLTRDVYRDQEKTQKVGSEVIPVINSDAYYSKSAISRTETGPKYTVFLGSSFDSHTGSKHLAWYLETKVKPNMGITAGYVNRGSFLGLSYSFGKR